MKARVPRFIAPCLPRPARKPPAGSGWLHEIKYDGYRLMAERRDRHVRLITKNGFDWTDRFPAVASEVAAFNCTSCVIDGEIVSSDERGVPSFAQLRSRKHPVQLYAFDLVELNGVDLRNEPIETRKELLRHLLNPHSTLVLYSERERKEQWNKSRSAQR